ncbi:hypothetical protein [Inquilinus limosus]|uniref:hypothetical protein n=1 Tax=Inquilinus limosus TaxID=171674 RepID=UPI0012DE8A0B|nr:hypothetical protein [Inquilinus limosus]
MDIGRFTEYSGSEAEVVSLAKPESLKPLELVPTLLMYETGVAGPNPKVVRHGRITNLRREGGRLSFEFEPHAERGYLRRDTIQEVSERLGMHRFEFTRTHWAIKDGEIPEELLAQATPEIPHRSPATIVDDYVNALSNGSPSELEAAREEFEDLPGSLEKAAAFLRVSRQTAPTFEAYPHLGVLPRKQAGRQALEEALATDPELWLNDNPLSCAWFLDLYGSPTEAVLLDQAIAACEARVSHLTALSEHESSPEELSETLWKCGRSQRLSIHLRSGINKLLSRLAQKQTRPGGYWQDRDGGLAIRATAMATVALQRLGDDKQRDGTRQAVIYLCSARNEDGSIVRTHSEDAGDVIATRFMLEAVRRSGLAAELNHVLQAGEEWLEQHQHRSGKWISSGWSDQDTTVAVLDYLTSEELCCHRWRDSSSWLVIFTERLRSSVTKEAPTTGAWPQSPQSMLWRCSYMGYSSGILN